MKSITQYIYEEYNKIELKELVVKFAVDGKDIVVEVPNNYLEDQVNVYLDDTIINKTFVSDEYSNDLFGKNSNYITDVYFEYTGINKTSLNANIKWEDGNSEENVDVTNLKKLKLSDFKFVITFNKFELFNDTHDETELQSVLYSIFERCISTEFEWPLPFILNEEDIEFKQ